MLRSTTPRSGTALHYLPRAGAELPLPMLEFSLLGALCLIGTIWLVVRASSSRRAQALGVGVLAIYLWTLLSMLVTAAGSRCWHCWRPRARSVSSRGRGRPTRRSTSPSDSGSRSRWSRCSARSPSPRTFRTCSHRRSPPPTPTPTATANAPTSARPAPPPTTARSTPRCASRPAGRATRRSCSPPTRPFLPSTPTSGSRR
ncbi:Arabinofuranosyltransferase N terminal [Mycobacteroides abscessus subsp. abscessus]|nr:Arabinofuranosyltransferase N terminal [Mycobacteroides abscessus subsp. abscessus]